MATLIDEEIRALITQAHEEARTILNTHAPALDRLAAALIDRETLDAQEVIEVLHDVPKWEHASNGSMRIQAPATTIAKREVAAMKASTEDGSKS